MADKERDHRMNLSGVKNPHLLQAGDRVTLTDAIVVHHPEAKYFNAG